MEIRWRDGFEIKVKQMEDAVIIEANRDGLLSLASQLSALAEEAAGSHVHYDENNSLEEGSAELIITKCGSDQDPPGECDGSQTCDCIALR